MAFIGDCDGHDGSVWLAALHFEAAFLQALC